MMKKLLTLAMIFGLSTFGWAENGSGIKDIPNEGSSYAKETNIKTTAKKAVTHKAVTTKSKKAAVKKGTYSEEIKMMNLPKFTRQYMKENFSVNQVRSVSREISGSGVGYQVKVSLDGDMTIIRFDKNGEPAPECL